MGEKAALLHPLFNIGHVHIHEVLHGVLYPKAHDNGLQKKNSAESSHLVYPCLKQLSQTSLSPCGPLLGNLPQLAHSPDRLRAEPFLSLGGLTQLGRLMSGFEPSRHDAL